MDIDSKGTACRCVKVNYSFLARAASNSSPLWVPLTLFIISLSSCHLAHFRRKCFASSTSCPLHSLHFLSSLPSPFHLPVSMRSCAVPPLSLVTILHFSFATHSNGNTFISTSSDTLECSHPTPRKIHMAHNCTCSTSPSCLQHPQTSAPYITQSDSTNISNSCPKLMFLLSLPHMPYAFAAMHTVPSSLPLICPCFDHALIYIYSKYSSTTHPRYVLVLLYHSYCFLPNIERCLTPLFSFPSEVDYHTLASIHP